MTFVTSGLGLVVLTAAGVFLWNSSRLDVVTDPSHRRLDCGAYAVFHVAVSNPTRRRRRVRVRLADVPARWVGAFSADAVLLEPYETCRLPFFLRIPFDETPGRTRVLRIQARSNTLSPWFAAATARIEIDDLDATIRKRRERAHQAAEATAVPVIVPGR
jgi:hypothetical protein